VSSLYEGSRKSSEKQNIDVDVIAERDGQQLRNYVVDLLRDLNFSDKKYRLTIQLTRVERAFAVATDGNARRVQLSYTANVVLKNEKGEAVGSWPVSVRSSSNISSLQGEVVFSLYARNNRVLLRELGVRIVENLRMFHEN
jgi:hypothetical protein